jgi:hypothetical protein
MIWKNNSFAWACITKNEKQWWQKFNITVILCHNMIIWSYYDQWVISVLCDFSSKHALFVKSEYWNLMFWWCRNLVFMKNVECLKLNRLIEWIKLLLSGITPLEENCLIIQRSIDYLLGRRSISLAHKFPMNMCHHLFTNVINFKLVRKHVCERMRNFEQPFLCQIDHEKNYHISLATRTW